MSGLVLLLGAGARFNWSRWLVDCGFCLSGLEPGRHLYDKHGVLVRYSIEWGDEVMTCWDCGMVTEGVAWPVDPLGIETLLLMRPDEKTRNWFPGETLDDLLQENIAHGIMPPVGEVEGGSVMLMRTEDERVVGGVVGKLVRQVDPSRRMQEIED